MIVWAAFNINYFCLSDYNMPLNMGVMQLVEASMDMKRQTCCLKYDAVWLIENRK